MTEPTFPYPSPDARHVWIKCNKDDPQGDEFWCPISGWHLMMPVHTTHACGQTWRKKVEVPENWEVVPEGELWTAGYRWISEGGTIGERQFTNAPSFTVGKLVYNPEMGNGGIIAFIRPIAPKSEGVVKLGGGEIRGISGDVRPLHDPVNHPAHYTKHPSGVECIQVTEHLNFCRGNAIKYIWRAGDKGNEIEDLKKARWYVDREIQRLEAK